MDTPEHDIPRPPPPSQPDVVAASTIPDSRIPPPPPGDDSAPSTSTLHTRSPQYRPQILPAPSSSASALLDPALHDSHTNPPSRPRTPRTKPRTPKPTTPQSMLTGSDGAQLLGPADANRPLNVTDALSYLDAVKVQFQDKPDVYNHFLDIMKDFKSQQIDTPGVIERVSMLFHGNPYLIQGFNTFLPPGYRIDLSSDPRTMNSIIVTTPMGPMTQTTLMGVPRLTRDPLFAQHMMGPFPNQPPFGPPPVLPVGLGPGSRPATPMSHPMPHGPSPFVDMPGPYSPAMQGAQAQAANFLGGLNGRAVEKSPAGEFNHAIQFLNKIKIRFSDEPDTYKQFLEILQTYQKEQRQLHDSQVFAQVSILFKNAPDLMEEFKDFLPEALGIGSQHGGLMSIMPHPTGGLGAQTPFEPFAETPPAGPDKATKAPSRRRKRVAEKEPPATQKAGTGRVVKRAKHNHKPEPGTPKFTSYEVPVSPQQPHAHPHPAAHPVRQQQFPPQPHPIQTAIPNGVSLSSQDELAFFDRTKRSLESGGTYDEFLKLLNLFARDIIDTKTLVERAEIFLEADLLTQFKELMGWDDKVGNVEFGPPGSIRTSAPDPIAPRAPDDGLGPSYRRLPDAEVRLACSGRDQLARSVLNDVWVSHPTWASEESGFIAHKKNSFEDTLHRSEEERHEYQVHIEALIHTIAVLDPLEARIDEMSAEERAAFRLKPDLGGWSQSVYQKTIKKIYGPSAEAEVYKALQESPSTAVPVVLARLKQKCEEWKRNQREWNKTWKEVDSKNFYKALDHQGITFKVNDKKNITAKAFVQDIESIKAEQAKAREIGGDNNVTDSLGRYQLHHEFQDTAVLHDSLRMIYAFLDHSQSQYSALERRNIERFLRSFIPTLFIFPPHEFNAACGQLEGGHEDDHMEDTGDIHDEPSKSVRTGRRSAGGGHSFGVAAGDLRKRLLKTVQENSPRGKHKGSPSRSTGSASPAPPESPLGSSKLVDLVTEDTSPNTDLRTNTEDVWIREFTAGPQDGSSSAVDATISTRPFFANTTFYTLLRLLQLLYSRLYICKETGAQLAKEKHASLLANPVAVKLGLDEPSGPSVVLAQAINAVGEASPGEEPNVLYMYLLDACEKVFENELEQATFEEHMRWFFGTKAYHVFTLDRVITAIIKQVQTITSDHKCQELWYLLRKGRSGETATIQDAVRYRREAERNVGSDDHLYRVDWNGESRTMRVQLVGVDDPSVGEDQSAVGRWREYVATYVTRFPTEWMSPAQASGDEEDNGRLFLKRCLIDPEETEKSDMVHESAMRIRVSLGTYKLFYEAGKEEVFWRRRGKEDDMLRVRAVARGEERKRAQLLK